MSDHVNSFDWWAATEHRPILIEGWRLPALTDAWASFSLVNDQVFDCLVGRKFLLISRRPRLSNLSYACSHTHTDTLSHKQNPIQTAHACSHCGSLLYGRAGVLLHEEAWLGTGTNSCKGVKINLKTSGWFFFSYFLDFIAVRYLKFVDLYPLGTGGTIEQRE